MKYLLLILFLIDSSPAFTAEIERDWDTIKKSVETAYHSGQLTMQWSTVSDPAELEKTWTDALVYLPERAGSQGGRLFKNSALLEQRLSNSIYPVILYMHSCTGLAFHREDMINLSKLGFVVIAPNSFARTRRPMGCFEDGEVLTRYAELVNAFQNAELEYAVDKLGQINWVDQNSMFLVGSGMLGGKLVAQYAGDQFKGHVIEGWGCHSPVSSQSGVWAPENVKIFSVVSADDPWYRQSKVSGYSGDCGAFLSNRQTSVSIVLDCPCHYGSWYPESRPALIKFLLQDSGVDYQHLLSDEPEIVFSDGIYLKLKRKWSINALYKAANKYCAKLGKKGHLTGPERNEIYPFQCG